MFSYLEAARVGSWIGWIFNFGFGSTLFGVLPFGRTVLVLVAFSLETASVFVLNQYVDREEDHENAIKAKLPVASGRLTPKRTLLYCLILASSSLVLAAIANIYILPLFIVSLGLSTAYSAPPVRLKSVPIADFLVSGIGAGVLPFVIGSGFNDEMITQIPTLLLGAIPLMLLYCGTHIIQAVGDYEADCKNGIRTFVVRYGRKNGVIVAGAMFLLAGVTPIVYAAWGFLPYRHLVILGVLFPLYTPIIRCYVKLIKTPSTQTVIHLQKTTRTYGLIVVTVLWAYTLLGRIVSF